MVRKPKLTKKEKEILHLLTSEFLTPNKIALRRGVSQQAISKSVVKLRKKEYLNQSFKGVVKSDTTLQPPLKKQPFRYIRLHAQAFKIELLFNDYRYKDIMNKSNTILVDGNTVRLFKNCILVYSHTQFTGDTVESVTAKSFVYWNRFFVRLENDLKVILIKHRKQNIKLVAQHYAEVNNELAKDLNIKKERLKIYAKEDGKVWFTIDHSFNLNEAETLHPETAREDMGDTVRPFFNDLRDKKPPKLSEIFTLLRDTDNYLKEASAGIASLVELSKPKKPRRQILRLEKNPSYIG